MRPLHKLSAAKVRAFTGRRIGDGGGLWLQRANGGKSWVFQYARHGRERAMGLGSARDVSLALARELAVQCREQLARGLDPIDARKAQGLKAREERAKLMTFAQCTQE